MSGGTTTGSQCNIKGDWLSCPANSEFEFNGGQKVLEAFLECPLDSVAQSEFVEASQQGKCQCSSSLRDKAQTSDEAEPIDCDCFACPVGSEFGFAYECNRPIFLDCVTFNCLGQCNQDFNAGLASTFVTEAPTAVPGGANSLSNSAAANLSSPVTSMTTAALSLLLIIKLFR